MKVELDDVLEAIKEAQRECPYDTYAWILLEEALQKKFKEQPKDSIEELTKRIEKLEKLVNLFVYDTMNTKRG